MKNGENDLPGFQSNECSDWCSEFDLEGGFSSIRKPTSRGVTELSSSYTGWMLELHRVEVAIPLSCLSLFSMLHYMHGMIT